MLKIIEDDWMWILLSTLVFAACLLTGGLVRRWTALGQDSSFRGRLRYIDGLRAVAALLVVAAHSVGPMAWILGNRTPLSLTANLGSLGVQIFFSISGFLFTDRILRGTDRTPAEFFRGRVRRILPLYLVMVTISIAIMLVFSTHPVLFVNILKPSLNFYLSGILPVPVELIAGNDPANVLGTIWTLRYEWMFYLSVPLLSFALESNKTISISTILVLIYAIATTDSRSTTIYWAFFIPGILTAIIRGLDILLLRRIVRRVRIIIPALFLFILFGDEGFTLFRLSEVFVLFSLIVLAEPKFLCNETLGFLGDISYSIYLVHFPVLFLAQQAISRFYQTIFTSVVSQIALEFLFVGVAIIVSSLTYRFIEVPFIREHRQQKYGLGVDSLPV
jgi:peptidoglycan/LPS O-acetylase OafA/YrhL